jgi:hypothetical protein
MRWSLDSGEYSDLKGAPADKMAEYVLAQATDRDIVLSHDDNHLVPQYLELVLPELKRRKYNLRNGLESVKWRRQ